VAHTPTARRAEERAELAVVAGVAVAVFAVHLALSGRYGFHRDELYYVAAGRHPALGYVDQPPVVPLLARALTAVAGEHLWPLRAVAGAVHAAVVVLAVPIARELGGGRRAQVLAAVAVAAMPLYLGAGSLFQTVVFDQLWWALALLLVVRLLNGADPRWWVAVGAVIGVGLETKWTMALLAAGLAAGLVAVPAGRRHLATPWLWAGGALALALWLPNLVWQALNDWPTLEFARNNNAEVRDEEGRLGFVVRQLGFLGPAALPLVGAGVVWLWRSARWRVLAVASATVAALLLIVGGKAYYLGPLYVLGAAAGAVAVEAWLAEGDRRWPRSLVALVVSGLLLLPVVAPVLPVDVYAGSIHEANGELGEQMGWPELVDLVAAVVAALPAEERAEVRIVTRSYGEAAAIDLYGPARGLPRGTALSAHNSYADWWPDGEPAGTVVTVRYPRRALEPYCGAVLGPLAVVAPPDGVDNEAAGTPILVCRDLLVEPETLRDTLRRFV
jgi:4-amino-4-deoxy-L-arabinose transferase-like glycosyltransferase